MSYEIWVMGFAIRFIHNLLFIPHVRDRRRYLYLRTTPFKTVQFVNLAPSLKNWFTASYLIGILLVPPVFNGQSRTCGIIG